MRWNREAPTMSLSEVGVRQNVKSGSVAEAEAAGPARSMENGRGLN